MDKRRRKQTKTLKEHTQSWHDKIEDAPFSRKFLQGEITERQWHYLLVQKSMIYALLNRRLDLPGEASQLSARLDEDCQGLSRVQMVATNNYLRHLEQLPENLLWAHVYVHYLGDMHGGQMLKKLAPDNRTRHLEFSHRVSAIKDLRDKVDHRAQELAFEACEGFRHIMDIQNEIFNVA